MEKTFYMLPNQLFSKEDLSKIKIKIKTILLWEHPDFFTKYNFNKKKLILHRASMKKHFDYLSKQYKVQYVEFNTKHTIDKNAVMFDPINDISDFKDVEKLESPNFLVSKKFNEDIYKKKKGKSSIRFSTYYYPRVKKHLQVLDDIENKDKENRKTLDKLLPKYKQFPEQSNENSLYIKDAIDYIEKHFKKKHGNSDNFNFPIDNDTARKWLDIFLKHRLKYFGTYQDAIIEDESMLYHSGLSSSINIGLLHPSYILKRIKSYKSKVGDNNYEGYIRQLIWREYQRYCYLFLKDDFLEKNKFVLNNELDESWYTGKTNVYPIDVTIKKAFSTAYLHHIERLMIIGNFMLLSRINKKDGFKWFMEFAIDSYEWLMYQNVYDMVFFSTGGKTTHKAYISSSNYVLKMSTYKKGDWTSIWDKKFRDFRKKEFNK